MLCWSPKAEANLQYISMPGCLCTGVDTVSPKIFEVENFRGFRGSENSREKIFPRNFKSITDARHGWKLDHENFIHEYLFLSRIWQNREIFNP